MNLSYIIKYNTCLQKIYFSQALPTKSKQKLCAHMNCLDLAVIGKKPLEVLDILIDKLGIEKLKSLYQSKSEMKHTSLHLGNFLLKTSMAEFEGGRFLFREFP